MAIEAASNQHWRCIAAKNSSQEHYKRRTSTGENVLSHLACMFLSCLLLIATKLVSVVTRHCRPTGYTVPVLFTVRTARAASTADSGSGLPFRYRPARHVQPSNSLLASQQRHHKHCVIASSRYCTFMPLPPHRLDMVRRLLVAITEHHSSLPISKHSLLYIFLLRSLCLACTLRLHWQLDAILKIFPFVCSYRRALPLVELPLANSGLQALGIPI